MVYPGGFEILAKGSLSSASSPGARGKPGVYAEDNQLRWKNRKGFARLAIKHQYTIIPCAVVSSDEMLTNLHELPSGWIRKDLPVGQKSFGEKSKFEKVYIWFGQPISTDQFSNGTEKDIEELRDLTRSSIREGIMEMKSRQDKDTERVIPGIPREKLSSEDYALKAFSERMAKFTEIQKTKKSKK
jgi:1-acyl-sn-glycerol-3-phosphate acyltransferase